MEVQYGTFEWEAGKTNSEGVSGGGYWDFAIKYSQQLALNRAKKAKFMEGVTP